ncbi:aminoglycoside phosphotransferase family protein [Pseudonocardia sp.]|uniref:aminoglycoside phosphotransferase family protein n=1 Tax=Pseudonocardia sp. TaxID=60912 RepID=UPI002635FE10|nr:aminoglycoside phosphotransferase family protein [Pseudonocardia sp.]
MFSVPMLDPRWPASLALLLGPGAGELIQVALHGVGGRLRALRVATVGVQPTGATVVQYTATVDRADGTTSTETLAATTGSRIPDGAAVVAGEVGGEPVEVGLWRWPQDPALPALATATDPHLLAAALDAAGLPHRGVARVRVRAYRPGRRAVLEVTGECTRLFCKVVRPAAVDALRVRHDLLAPVLPVPPVLAATGGGLVVLPAAAGTPVRALLSEGGAPPGGPELDALLDRLPPALVDLPTRRSAPGGHLDRARHFADVLALTSHTGCTARLDALVERLAVADRGDHPTVAVHGDFYESQLHAEGGRVTALLDVDTAGGGRRIDDWATLLAHLSVLGGPARSWGAELLAHAERRFARAQLRPRVAAAVLGLATGPFRVQQPGWADHSEWRVALAERWLAGVPDL